MTSLTGLSNRAQRMIEVFDFFFEIKSVSLLNEYKLATCFLSERSCQYRNTDTFEFIAKVLHKSPFVNINLRQNLHETNVCEYQPWYLDQIAQPNTNGSSLA